MNRDPGGRRALALARKTRITIYLDHAVLVHFKGVARRTGQKYQTLMNDALAATLAGGPPITATLLRRVLRDELRKQRR